MCETVSRIHKRYDNFKDEDREHIPQPPQKAEVAFLILAIGDDASIPEVINPMIDLATILDGFGQCVFYDRVGPISRQEN